MKKIFKAMVVEIDGFQTIDLPPELQFEADEVWIRRDELTGDFVLSERPPDQVNPATEVEHDKGLNELR